MATLGSRAISRMAGGGSGVTNAKKLADLYVSTNTNNSGEVSDPTVYDNVINSILAPFAGTVDGQNAIADYRNKQKALTSKNADTESAVSALKQKEYGAWYVDDDGSDNTSFRNPGWVAQVTSESLDMILAETVQTIDARKASNKDTADLETYLSGLIKRSDRMRTVADSLNDGTDVNLDGYGYYVDADPNTGQIRGASFMPTDANFGGLSQDTIRTNSTVKAGNKTIPVYLPFVKQEDGTTKATFGGKEYTGNTTLLSDGGDGGDTPLTDKTSYPGVDSKFQVGGVYRSFNGKTNIDGSSKQDYFYVGRDNKMYKFADDDPNGKALLDSLKQVGAVGDTIPRISPADAASYVASPLPGGSSFTQGEQQGGKIRVLQGREAESKAQAEALANRNPLEEVVAGASDLVKGFGSGIASFFSRKNAPNKPDTSKQTVDGAFSAPDVINAGASFFRKPPIQ